MLLIGAIIGWSSKNREMQGVVSQPRKPVICQYDPHQQKLQRIWLLHLYRETIKLAPTSNVDRVLGLIQRTFGPETSIDLTVWLPSVESLSDKQATHLTGSSANSTPELQRK